MGGHGIFLLECFNDSSLLLIFKCFPDAMFLIGGFRVRHMSYVCLLRHQSMSYKANFRTRLRVFCGRFSAGPVRALVVCRSLDHSRGLMVPPLYSQTSNKLDIN